MRTRQLIIDPQEIFRKIKDIKFIAPKIDSLINNQSFDLKFYDPTIKDIYNTILEKTYLMYVSNINPLHVDRYISSNIVNYFVLLGEFVKENNDKKNLLHNDFRTIHNINHGYKNNMIVFEQFNYNMCSNCELNYIYKNKQHVCPKCNKVREKSYIYRNVNETAEEVRQDKKNISKHYDDTIKRIYGYKPKEKSLPVPVINKFKEYLIMNNVDIRNTLHYTFNLLAQMRKKGSITWDGKTYNLREYKNQCNYILITMYPDLKIPRLTIDEMRTLKNAFMNISSTFQQQNPAKYSNNYMYTLFKEIYILFPYRAHARQLLRFIYIQKPASFPEKDRKLKLVNDEANIFNRFIYTSDNIYGEEKFYVIEPLR